MIFKAYNKPWSLWKTKEVEHETNFSIKKGLTCPLPTCFCKGKDHVNIGNKKV